MKVRRQRLGVVELVTVDSPTGGIDQGRSELLRQELVSVAESSGSMVLDLGAVEILTSSGIGALITTRRRVRGRGGRFVLPGVSPALRKLLRQLRVLELFEVAADVERALEELGEEDEEA